MPVARGIHYSIYQPKENIPSRPPLILIHGAGGSFLSWHPHLRRLQNEIVYALDLPGHGESIGKGKSSIEEYADDIASFMDELQIHSAVIAGLSMGSGIALTLALNHPQKVKALALFGSGAKLRVAPAILKNIGSPETFTKAVEQINRACFSENAPNDLLALSQKHMLATGPSVLLQDFLACSQFDVTTQLAKIQCPTLILCGANDVMTPPKHSHHLKDNLANARLHILEKTGHMLTLEQPEIAANLLKHFLDELPFHS